MTQVDSTVVHDILEVPYKLVNSTVVHDILEVPYKLVNSTVVHDILAVPYKLVNSFCVILSRMCNQCSLCRMSGVM